jgi:hypothetical protein
MQTRNLKITILAFTVLLICSGCSKWLDKPRPEATVPIDEIGSGTGGLDAALTGAWAYWTYNTGPTGNLFVYPEAMGKGTI